MAGLLEHNRMVVNQKAKLIEITNEYKIRDEQGNDIGVIRQEGQSKVRKALRLLTQLDDFFPVNLAVYDASGAKVVHMHRPAKVFKSRIEVTDPGGAAVGRIVQQNMFGKVRFSLEGSGGMPLGELRAENWRAWDFHIANMAGTEVARITKKWSGLGKEIFTTADNYMVELSPGLTGALRVLAVAAAAGVDTALKQWKAG